MLGVCIYFTNNILNLEKLSLDHVLKVSARMLLWFYTSVRSNVVNQEKLRSMDHVFNTGNLKVNVWMLIGFYFTNNVLKIEKLRFEG